MSAITDILGQLPLGDLASKLGVSESQAKSASTEVITSLLGGMTANAQDSGGEQSLATALTGHVASGQSFAADGVKLDDLDTDDGGKIVQHALGADTAKTAAAISQKTGTDQSLLQKLLPMLAPVVLGYIAQQAMPNAAGANQGGANAASLLGGLLGGGSSAGGNVVGSLVGGLLGGGSANSAGGGLGSLLGGLLGGATGGKATTTKPQSGSGGVLGGLLDSIF
ncbi:MAG: DUF937 domain-containing protein [Propionibacteriaceae bacterium]|jgi:hypothetical protein|nr:DUF937 domain-containing protein [Propionibacteriaceae bacterium]